MYAHINNTVYFSKVFVGFLKKNDRAVIIISFNEEDRHDGAHIHKYDNNGYEEKNVNFAMNHF